MLLKKFYRLNENCVTTGSDRITENAWDSFLLILLRIQKLWVTNAIKDWSDFMQLSRLDLISQKEEFIHNAIKFNEELMNHTIPIEKLITFYRWYYIPSLNCFVPSKYVKYRDMNYNRYIKYKSLGSHGKVSDINKKFKEWFTEITSDDELFWELSRELLKVLKFRDLSKLNSRVDRFFLLNEDY